MGYEVTFYLTNGNTIGHYINTDKTVNVVRADIGGKIWDAMKESMFVKLTEDMEINPNLVTHFIVKEHNGAGK